MRGFGSSWSGRRLAPAVALAVLTMVHGPGEARSQALIDELAGQARRAGGAVIRERAVAVGESQSAWDTICNAQQGTDKPVIEWTYTRTDILCLRTRETMFTTVFLPADDRVVDYNVGDESAFEVIQAPKRPNVLLIRPKGGMVDVDTQLTVTGRSAGAPETRRENFDDGAPWSRREGGRNVYTFYLRSTGVDAKDLPHVTVFVHERAARGPELPAGVYSGRMGEDAASERALREELGRLGGRPAGLEGAPGADAGEGYEARPARPARDDRSPEPGPAIEERDQGDEAPDYLREIPLRLADLRFGNYQVRAQSDDAVSIAPVNVVDDGRFTLIDFGEGARADNMLRPIVKEIVDGIESNVNTRTVGPTGNMLVVEAVGDLVLRNGNRIVCLVYGGSGAGEPGVVVGDASARRRAAGKGAFVPPVRGGD